jgi:hypothetical protein
VMGLGRGLKRKVRRYRRWWPELLALSGGLVIAALAALRGGSVAEGILGPVIATAIIGGIGGLLAGVAEGLVQPPPPFQLRIRLGLVVLVLLVAALANGSALGSLLAALVGAAVALGLGASGARLMAGLIGRDEDSD